MAQWLGQFTGNTHATAVRDAENLLRHAVDALHTAAPNDREKKAKAARGLAKRVYSARVRFLKARIAAATDPNVAEVLASRRSEIDRLRAELSALEAANVEGVLREFFVVSADVP